MKKGFTLVEMLIVLVVIGIILAVVLPNALRAIEQANVRDTAATLRSIDTAVNLCYSQTRTWASCDSLAELRGATPPYLELAPITLRLVSLTAFRSALAADGNPTKRRISRTGRT